MNNRVFLLAMFWVYSTISFSGVIDDEGKTDSPDEKFDKQIRETKDLKGAIQAESELEKDLEILRLSQGDHNFPDCTKYSEKSSEVKSCLIAPLSPIEENASRTWMEMEKVVQIENSEAAMKAFNKELHKDAFLSTWGRREFFRKLYPDLEITKEEKEAEACGKKMAECSEEGDKPCVDKYVTDEMQMMSKPGSPKELDEERKFYLQEQLVRALIASASLSELKKWDGIHKKSEESNRLKEQHLKSLDSVQIESPLLFKRDREWYKRIFNTASKAGEELFLDTKTPYKESDFMRFIVQKIDPSEKLRKQITEMINEGKSTKENIAALMDQSVGFLRSKLDSKGKHIGDEKIQYPSVTSFFKNDAFMKELDSKMKNEAGNFMGILGASARVTCEKRSEWPPYLHHYPALVQKTLARLDKKYKTDLMKNQVKAGFCFASQKFKMDDPKVSSLMVMGATGLGVGAAALAIPGIGAPTAAILGLSSLAIYSMKDALFSDADLVEIYGNKYATSEKIAKVSDAAGKNNLLMFLDGIMVPGDLAPLTVKFTRRVGANKLLKTADEQGRLIFETATLEDKKVLRNLLEDMALKNSPGGKIVREQINPFSKANKENQELVLEVLKKIHDDMVNTRKSSGGISKSDLMAEFERRLKTECGL